MGDKVTKGMRLYNRLKIFVFAEIIWAFWRSRNRMTIEHSFPKNPLDVIRSGVAFVQKWQPLLGASDQEEIATLGEQLKT